MARFRIRELAVDTIIGVYEWEREILQRLAVSVEFCADIREAACTDDLDKTIDYDDLSKQIRAWADEQNFELIETLAVGILRLVIAQPLISWAEVTVGKPGALEDAKMVEVTVNSSDDL